MSRMCTTALIVAFVVGPSAARGDEPAKRTGTVVGRVVDLRGRPIAGADVWAGDRDQVAVRAHTDTEGRYRLGPIGDERAATVWAEHEGLGLAREHFDEVRVHAGRETDVGNLSLAPGARLIGRAIDARGRPIAGARTTIESWHHILGHTISPSGPKWTVPGGEDGRFRTPALPAGKADLAITAPGKARKHIDRLIEPGQTAIDLGEVRLDDERPITGLVVDQDGRPVAGATVYVDGDRENTATTGGDGHFTVPGAAIDASWVYLDAPGYFDPSQQPYHELAGKRTDLKLTLQKAFTVAGSVLDAETGAPVNIEHVQLCTVDRDKDGHVTLVG